MENTRTVCTQVAPSPRSNNHGRGQPQENVLLGRMGEWEKGVAIKDNVMIVEKVGIWPICALLNIKLQQKRTKRKGEKLYSYKLLTSLIQPIFTNYST